MKESIVKIIESYKGAKVESVFVSNKGVYVNILANAPKVRTMQLASVKILNQFPSVEFVNWQGAWLNYVYLRRTLSHIGYNLKKVAE